MEITQSKIERLEREIDILKKEGLSRDIESFFGSPISGNLLKVTRASGARSQNDKERYDLHMTPDYNGKIFSFEGLTQMLEHFDFQFIGIDQNEDRLIVTIGSS